MSRKAADKPKTSPVPPTPGLSRLVVTADDKAWAKKVLAQTKTDALAAELLVEQLLTMRAQLRDLRSGRRLAAEESRSLPGLVSKCNATMRLLGLLDVSPDEEDEDL